MSTSPIILDSRTLKPITPPFVSNGGDAIRALLGPQTAAAPPLAPIGPSMPGANPLAAIPAPAAPNAIAPRGTLQGDQNELQRITAGGSGIQQILHPVDANGNPTGEHVGLLRKLGGIGATIGDTALRLVAPKLEQMIPGTEGHHQFLIGQDRQILGNDQANATSAADLAQKHALTQYTLARPDIEQSKIDQRQTAVQERVGQAAAARGQLVSWDENGIPTFSDDHTSQAFADHQALSAMHQATAEKSTIMADIAKNHYIPGTPEWAEAQKKLAQVDQRLQIAMGSLGLRAKGLQLRQNDQQANFYGLGPDGNALPNAPQFVGDDGSVTTGGLRGAKTAITQQGAAGQFRDLGGSIRRTQAYLDALHDSGSDLSDPRVVDALQSAEHDHGTISTVLHSKLIKSGLTDAQVNAIAGLASFQEQLGTLRAAAKGTSSEAQTVRMLNAAPVAGDTKDLANRKMIEMQATYDRLSPSISTISGGLSLNGKGGHQSHAGTPPAGMTHIVPGPDGKNHYTNAAGTVDGGIAP